MDEFKSNKKQVLEELILEDNKKRHDEISFWLMIEFLSQIGPLLFPFIQSIMLNPQKSKSKNKTQTILLIHDFHFS